MRRLSQILSALWLLGCAFSTPLRADAGAPAEELVHVCFEERDQSAYLYRDAQGQWQGAAYELVKRGFARAGLSVRFHPMPWGRCLREVADFGRRGGSSQMEALFYASLSPERERQFLASDALHQLRGGVWYSRRQFAQPPVLQQLQDLAGYRLCGLMHHNYQWLREAGVQQLDAGAPSLRAALAKLERQRCEMVLSSLELVQGSERAGLLPVDPQRAFVPFPGQGPVSQHVLLSRGSPRAEALRSRLNAGLRQLRREGIADAIYQRHLSAPAPAPPAIKGRLA